MLTPDDERSDGNKRAYLDEENEGSWRDFDPNLYDLLQRTVSNKALKKRGLEKPTEQDLRGVENKGLIGGTEQENLSHYIHTKVPRDRSSRLQFREECMQELASASLIFYDPDNGIEVKSCPKGRKDSIKFIYLDELAEAYTSKKSIIVYQHFPRMRHDEVIENKRQELSERLSGAKIWAYETSDVVFFLAAQPHHSHLAEKFESDFTILVNDGLYRALHTPK